MRKWIHEILEFLRYLNRSIEKSNPYVNSQTAKREFSDKVYAN